MTETLDIFYFKQFQVIQRPNVMKVGTDGVLLGAVAHHPQPKTILDIGTGSGLIAMMVAQSHSQAEIHAIDISQDAIDLARTNFENSPFKTRLKAFAIGVSDFAETRPTAYDLIVSNPPFFSGGNFSPSAYKNLMRQTFQLSHQDLLRSVHKLLGADGVFWVILPHLEGLRFVEMARFYNLQHNTTVKVISRADKPIERLILKFSHQKETFYEDTLYIHLSENNEYSPDYIAKTKNFYPFMPD